MNKFQVVENNPKFLRDISSKAIVSIDSDSRNMYLQRKKYLQTKESKLEEFNSRISHLENKIDDILEKLNIILNFNREK